MSRVEEIERAIEQLSPDEFARIAGCVRDIEQRRWDERLDRDAAAGKLDFLEEEAKTEDGERLLKDWPSSR